MKKTLIFIVILAIALFALLAPAALAAQGPPTEFPGGTVPLQALGPISGHAADHVPWFPEIVPL